MAALQDLTDKLARIEAALTGIRGDIAALKAIVEGHAGGMTADEVATLTGLVEGLATKAESLDAENPAPASEPTPPEA